MTICPHCGREIYCLHIDCPHCGKRIPAFFTINAFFRENSHYFMIIGVIGTMIALLPTLGEKVIGNEWISNDLSLLSVSLAFLFIFGDLLLLGIFFILINKIWDGPCRNEEEPSYSFSVLQWWKKGDTGRLAITFCLVPMMVALIGFLLLILFYSENSFVIGLTILIIVLIVLLFEGYIVIDLMIKIFDTFKRKWKIVLSMAILVFFFIWLVLFSPWAPSDQAHLDYKNPENIELRPEEILYHPQISSNKALKIEVTNTKGLTYGYNWMHWTTNYGYFVSMNPPNSKIKLLGNNTTTKGSNIYENQEIYWTYPLSDIGKDKPPINISLVILSTPEKNALANSSIQMNWLDTDVVINK